MKLKLNHTEFTDLYDLLKDIHTDPKPEQFAARMVYNILMQLHKKFYQRALEKRKVYRITLTEDQALAFWLHFIQISGYFPVTSTKGNTLNQMLSNIHQQYIKPC